MAGGEEPLGISTLRGEFQDNQEWGKFPFRPAVICGTVDMVGSRLLFSGYGDRAYPVTGDPLEDSRSLKKINARTVALTVKKDGKVTTSGRIVVAPDGKSRTVTTTRSEAKGKKVRSIAVYDKE
jgi:hypothetical protein